MNHQRVETEEVKECKRGRKFDLNGCPDSKQILLWIGSAIAIIVAALWVVIQDKVDKHHHSENATQTDIQRVINSQDLIEQRMDSISSQIREQNRLILDMHQKWLVPHQRSSPQ